MQELAWLIKNDVDLEKAQSNQFYRVPFLELGPLIPRIILEKVKKLESKSVADANTEKHLKLTYTQLNFEYQ